MEFVEEDFNRMRFNPMAVPQGKLLVDHYPELTRIFTSEVRLNISMQFGNSGTERVAKYICFMYDPNSPLRSLSNYALRKSSAMRLARFPITMPNMGEPVFPDDASDSLTRTPHRDLFTNKLPLTNRLIVLFIRAFMDYKYAYLCALEETYWRNLESMIDGHNTASGDKSSMDTVDKAKAKLDEVYAEIFTEKPERELTQETMMVMEEDKLGIEPEDMAKRLKNGEYIKPH